jgi:hypothetical protein
MRKGPNGSAGDRENVSGMPPGGSRGKSFIQRHPVLKWTALSLGVLFVLLVAAVALVVHRAEPMLRGYIVAGLERHFHARVELDSFHVSLTGGLRAEGKGLRIWPPAEVHGVTIPNTQDDKPLISLQDFRFRAPLHYSPGQPIRISVVQLHGLTIDMPPKSRFTHTSASNSHAPDADASNASGPNASGPNAGSRNASGQEASGASASGSPKVESKMKQALIHFVIGSIDCSDVHLTLETSKPGKLPLQFQIASLLLTGIRNGGEMQFKADLINARPVGVIHTSGTFGPWSADDPGESGITGQYTFNHANLGDFKGIAGTLDSVGKFSGVLRDLVVDGTTDTPDFRLTHFGTPMPLHTNFHAHVDATNGDTYLQPVMATLGSSQFTAAGEVVRVPATPQKPGGHEINLLIDIPHGRMEDFLRLTSKNGDPLMTGVLNMKATLEIPPGKEPVHHRIRLKGHFSLTDSQFTSDKIQSRMASLSLRGQGDPKAAKKDAGAADVRASMISNFAMDNAIITLPNLTYSIPGADVAMAGAYGVDGGRLDFSGTAKMQATVSKMLGGWKGILAKPVDRFFKKDGAGTVIPIHIDGTRDNPHFSLDFNRLKTTSPQSPGQSQKDQPQKDQSPKDQPQKDQQQ